jgi:Zn-dependent protease
MLVSPSDPAEESGIAAAQRQDRRSTDLLRLLLASFSVGRLFGVPIRLHWSSLIGLALLLSLFCDHPAGRPPRLAMLRWVVDLIFIAALAASILMHELAHALAAKKWGVDTRAIFLHVFGGLAWIVDPAVLCVTSGQKMAIFAAGPVSNLVCCCSALLLARLADSYIVRGLIETIAAINLGMGFFNLLPIWPLDGGQLFHAFLSLIGLRPRWVDGITLTLSLLLGVPFACGAWESGTYFNLCVALILLIAAVTCLAVFRLEPGALSAGMPPGPEPAAEEHSGTPAVTHDPVRSLDIAASSPPIPQIPDDVLDLRNAGELS